MSTEEGVPVSGVGSCWQCLMPTVHAFLTYLYVLRRLQIVFQFGFHTFHPSLSSMPCTRRNHDKIDARGGLLHAYIRTICSFKSAVRRTPQSLTFCGAYSGRGISSSGLTLQIQRFINHRSPKGLQQTVPRFHYLEARQNGYRLRTFSHGSLKLHIWMSD